MHSFVYILPTKVILVTYNSPFNVSNFFDLFMIIWAWFIRSICFWVWYVWSILDLILLDFLACRLHALICFYPIPCIIKFYYLPNLCAFSLLVLSHFFMLNLLVVEFLFIYHLCFHSQCCTPCCNWTLYILVFLS